MAIRVNLLPWRAELRQKRKQATTAFLIVAFALASLVCGAVYYHLNSIEKEYISTVQMVKDKTANLSRKLSQKSALEALKVKIKNQIDAIEALQKQRSTSTHVMEDFANAIPEKLFIRSFSMNGLNIVIDGAASNEYQLTELMINLEKSKWFENPELTYISKSPSLPNESKDFQIRTKVKIASGEQSEE